MVKVKSCLIQHWRQLVILTIPLVTLPLPLIIQDDAATVGFLMIVMAVYWCLDVLPLAVTGMIPIFFLPLTGIMTSSQVAAEYMKDSSLMFTAAMFVASGIEDTQLHRRIALNILRLVGTEPNWLMFGFMLPTWFLSMWISNTATTAMMLPIMEAVMTQLERDMFGDSKSLKTKTSSEPSLAQSTSNDSDYSKEKGLDPGLEMSCVYLDDDVDKQEHLDIDGRVLETSCVYPDDGVSMVENLNEASPQETSRDGIIVLTGDSTTDLLDNMEPSGASFRVTVEDESGENDAAMKTHRQMAIGMTLAIAYTASIGGMTTLTGCTQNLIMKQHADDLWIEKGMDEESPINYATWLVMGFPVSVICFVIVWTWLQLFYVGPRGMCGCCLKKKNSERARIIKDIIKREYNKLGTIRYAEVVVAIALFAMVMLWFFRSPGFMPGWADLSIFKDGYISDAVVSSLVAFILFCIPFRPPICGFEQEKLRGRVRTILTWDHVQSKYPWFIIFMIGGGFCLAEASQISGLSDWIGDQLTALGVLPDWLMVAVVCIAVAFMTDIISNNATASILMPVMASMAEGLGYNPIYLMLPVACTCSFAFMLPVGTVPNSLAFSYGRLKVMDMVKTGVVLNILCVIPVTLAIHTWVYDFFDLGTIPWADIDNSTTTMIMSSVYS